MIIGFIMGMLIGGTIVYIFKDSLTKDEVAVVNAFNAEAAKLKSNHATATVAAVKTVTTPAV